MILFTDNEIECANAFKVRRARGERERGMELSLTSASI